MMTQNPDELVFIVDPITGQKKMVRFEDIQLGKYPKFKVYHSIYDLQNVEEFVKQRLELN